MSYLESLNKRRDLLLSNAIAQSLYINDARLPHSVSPFSQNIPKACHNSLHQKQLASANGKSFTVEIYPWHFLSDLTLFIKLPQIDFPAGYKGNWIDDIAIRLVSRIELVLDDKFRFALDQKKTYFGLSSAVGNLETQTGHSNSKPASNLDSETVGFTIPFPFLNAQHKFFPLWFLRADNSLKVNLELSDFAPYIEMFDRNGERVETADFTASFDTLEPEIWGTYGTMTHIELQTLLRAPFQFILEDWIALPSVEGNEISFPDKTPLVTGVVWYLENSKDDTLLEIETSNLTDPLGNMFPAPLPSFLTQRNVGRYFFREAPGFHMWSNCLDQTVASIKPSLLLNKAKLKVTSKNTGTLGAFMLCIRKFRIVAPPNSAEDRATKKSIVEEVG